MNDATIRVKTTNDGLDGIRELKCVRMAWWVPGKDYALITASGQYVTRAALESEINSILKELGGELVYGGPNV